MIVFYSKTNNENEDVIKFLNYCDVNYKELEGKLNDHNDVAR